MAWRQDGRPCPLLKVLLLLSHKIKRQECPSEGPPTLAVVAEQPRAAARFCKTGTNFDLERAPEERLDLSAKRSVPLPQSQKSKSNLEKTQEIFASASAVGIKSCGVTWARAYHYDVLGGITLAGYHVLSGRVLAMMLGTGVIVCWVGSLPPQVFTMCCLTMGYNVLGGRVLVMSCVGHLGRGVYQVLGDHLGGVAYLVLKTHRLGPLTMSLGRGRLPCVGGIAWAGGVQCVGWGHVLSGIAWAMCWAGVITMRWLG